MAQRLEGLVAAAGGGGGVRPAGSTVLPGAPSEDWPAEWREPWERVAYFLRAREPPFDALEAVAPERARALYEGREDAVLLDVRNASDWERAHAVGALSLPLFQPIQGSSWAANRRRLAYASLGVTQGTEPNEAFAEEVLELAGGDRARPVVLICSFGGTPDPQPGLETGVRSRSLLAAYQLLRQGFTAVKYVDGGLKRWYDDGLPTTLDYDEVPMPE